MNARNETSTNLPALLQGEPRLRGAAASGRPCAGFAAQALGAGGERRGLKGGRPVLDAARAAYGQVQWSGAADRRARPGARSAAVA